MRWHIHIAKKKKLLTKNLCPVKLSLYQKHKSRDDNWMFVSVRIEFAAGNRKHSLQCHMHEKFCLLKQKIQVGIMAQSCCQGPNLPFSFSSVLNMGLLSLWLQYGCCTFRGCNCVSGRKKGMQKTKDVLKGKYSVFPINSNLWVLLILHWPELEYMSSTQLQGHMGRVTF